jgi:phenylpropionate dioxygenase-like ring-hydroxylating dioxygenase large terminal subunit
VPINYKTIVDGFNEIYHVTELHHSPPEFTKATRFASFHVTGDNFMCFVPRPASLDELSSESYDHHRNSICHYVVFPNTVFNCNPEHIQVFQPIPLAVDRTKFLCWELIYPGDQSDPEYAAYYKKTMAHWEVLKGVVGEDISIYDQMTRTKKSSAFTEQILSEREFKIAMYHQNMDRKIRD